VKVEAGLAPPTKKELERQRRMAEREARRTSREELTRLLDILYLLIQTVTNEEVICNTRETLNDDPLLL
jgi:hypothetical protein